MNTRRRARVAIALASCALLTAPVAQAALLQGDDHALTFASAATPIVAAGDDHARTTSGAAATPIVAVGDDHARTTSGVAATRIAAPRDDHARKGSAPLFPPHGGIPLPTVQAVTSQTAASASGGFDWEDAGVGFGTAAGIAVLAAGTLMSTRKLRGPRVSSV